MERMKIDLSDLSDGDQVFLISEGYVKINCIIDNIIHLSCGITVYNSGKEYDPEDAHPVCFHSIEECIEYFQSAKKEMDEANKPKKRYWLWSTKGTSGYYYKNSVYFDDEGKNTNGDGGIGWHELEKIKHKNEFIDV